VLARSTRLIFCFRGSCKTPHGRVCMQGFCKSLYGLRIDERSEVSVCMQGFCKSLYGLRIDERSEVSVCMQGFCKSLFRQSNRQSSRQSGSRPARAPCSPRAPPVASRLHLWRLLQNLAGTRGTGILPVNRPWAGRPCHEGFCKRHLWIIGDCGWDRQLDSKAASGD
jgi:hypothetical protein